MKMLRNKSKVAIAILLLLSFAISMFAVLPTVKGQITKVPDRETGAYISVNPHLIGINQELTVNLWVYPSPDGPHGEMSNLLTGYGGLIGMHFRNLTVTFTRPDGSKDTFMPLHGSASGLGLKPGETDEVGGIWFYYKPNQLGNWSLSFSFPGDTYIVKGYSVFYKPSTSQTIKFTLQEDPVRIGFDPVPLPTGYWERPITSDNREWSQISGDWFGNIVGSFNPYSQAPNSAHILWTKEMSLGGLVGGEWGTTSYFDGGGGPALISNGRLYYNMPTASGTMMTCVDLRTGELIWQTAGSISAGRNLIPTGIYEYGGSPIPMLWQYSSSSWRRYDAWSGALSLNIAVNTTYLGGPVWLDKDVCYVLRNAGIPLYYTTTSGGGVGVQVAGALWDTATNRRLFVELIKWNLSKSGTTWESKIEWRVDLLNRTTGLGPGESSRGASFSIVGNMGVVTENCGDIFYGIDLNTGKILWSYRIPFYSMTNTYTPEKNLIVHDSANMILHCYKISAAGMTHLWESQVGQYPWGSQIKYAGMAYGNLYIGAYDGRLYCVDLATGKEKWAFYVGDTTETPYGTWAIYASSAIADGKVYFGTTEHSPTQPRTRGNKLFCVDAYTGKGVWNVTIGPSWTGGPFTIAEGYLIGTSETTGLMFCFGKGKTATTVSIQDDTITQGDSVLIKGTVLDQSPASAGTAAISDADMSAWMEYLHQLNATLMNNPPNAKGVDVSLDAIDPNNNFVHIGTASSDSSGAYGVAFAPEVPGLYKIIATFAGSESYWASYAETFVNVEEAHAVTSPAETIVPDNMPIYAAIIGAAIAIIIAVAIVGILILKKR